MSGMSMVRSVIQDQTDLVLTTLSGTVYTLHRANPESREWNVVRNGVEGRTSYHHEVRVRWSSRTNELLIGPWITTGLKEIEVR